MRSCSSRSARNDAKYQQWRYSNHESNPMKNHTFHAIGTMIVLALTAIQSLAQSVYEPYTFTTLAGGGGFISLDEAGNAARFAAPFGMAVDSATNVHVADSFNHAIRKVTPDAAVTTLAGLAVHYGRAPGS